MSTKREVLLQAIGAYGVQCSETQELAPSRELIQAIEESFPKTETARESDTSFTQSFDARNWAKAFVRHVWENKNLPYDEGAMIGWFANAIMRGYDEVSHELEKSNPTQDVLREVEEERSRQDEKWGGPEHDDCQGRSDWFMFRQDREHLVNVVVTENKRRKFLIEIAALAVAQIESLDRQTK